jgi:two-component system response regulator (stage 0 sporulation protein A)
MEIIEIERLIRTLGIGATYRGYRYLSYGVYLCLQDENYLLSVSKLLYPEIAHTYATTSCSVERDIRTVVKVCWERGNKTYLQKLAMHSLDARPTAGEFIDILVGHIKQT